MVLSLNMFRAFQTRGTVQALAEARPSPIQPYCSSKPLLLSGSRVQFHARKWFYGVKSGVLMGFSHPPQHFCSIVDFSLPVEPLPGMVFVRIHYAEHSNA